MKKSTKISLLVGGIAVVLIGVIGITFAFFSTGGIQDTANTFQSGCLNISLTDASASINLNNIYPITDIEGLDTTSYDFTITNTCNTDANYQINLESLNQVANSLSADYIKVSLSSDTVGNIISILSDNTSVTPEVEGAYEAYNLYIGTLGASETKTYHLKLWLDYDATVEVAANKVYSSKINVVAKSNIKDNELLADIKVLFTQYDDEYVMVEAEENIPDIKYCSTTDNICEPTLEPDQIVDNRMRVFAYNLKQKSKKVSTILGNIDVNLYPNEVSMCVKVNDNSKIVCSEPMIIEESEDFFDATPCKGQYSCGFTNGIYEAQDDDGTTYYFRGTVDNNWVKFGGFYWRIIRINGDGTLRLIYSGSEATGPVTTGEGTQIGTSAFNTNYNDNAYVGYMYGTPGSSTYEETHANVNDSTIKQVLDQWYEDNLLDNYAQYIDTNAGFCNDRTPYSGSGTGTTATDYAASHRLYTTNVQPTFECSNSNNLFTTSGSSGGNKVLRYPIGLITADEVVYAGGSDEYRNEPFYLYTGQNYWTMSPRYFNSGYAYVFSVSSYGQLINDIVNWQEPWGVRPVINLRSDVTITGSGTIEDPYIVQTD